MKKLLSLLLASFLLLTQSPSLPGTFAQSSEDIRSFLEEFEVVRQCLKNQEGQEEKPLNLSIAVCFLIQVFDQPGASLSKTWQRAEKIGLIAKNANKSEKISGFSFLSLLFQEAGVTISPSSEANYRQSFLKLKLRLKAEDLKTLATALEKGLIPYPETASEAKALKQKLEKKSFKITDALAFLYQVATAEHERETVMTISPFIPPSEEVALESVLKEIIRTIRNQSYYSKDFDEKSAMENALKALVKSLEQDKYIEYYTEQEYQDFSSGLNGQLEGIGAYIEEKEGKIIVVSPIEGSPAMKAGVFPGDIITHINGESTEGMTLQQAVQKIRGPKGSVVKLNIQRNSQKLEFSITREKITVPALTVNSKDGFEIIKLVQFGSTSAIEMLAELKTIAQKAPKAIIIDLRNNPGGFLNEVVNIVDYFLEKNKPIVFLQDRHDRVPVNATVDPIVKDIPIAILINKGSASASEILAGVLQSYGIAKVYGETSFGKGTVQNIITLQGQNQTAPSAFKFTTAEYLIPLPNGDAFSIDGKGVKPNDNPGGPDSPLLDDRNTTQDEALDAVIGILNGGTGRRR